MTDDNTNDSNPPVPTTTAELLDRIRDERTVLEASLNGLSDAAYTAVESPGEWSLKDHLMHIVAWEDVLLGALAREPEHLTLGLEECVASTIGVDELNALFYRRNRDLPLASVLEAFATTRQKVLAAVGRLNDEDLGRPCNPDDPESTLRVDKIRWNTYEHYLEHRTWLAARRN